MNFKNGYLGCFLVVVAVVLTILGSYVMSLDVEEREVIKYSQVAELTGLFDSDQAPAYIDYSPSTNYTGYYTDPDTEYYVGVDARTTSQPNQYRLNLAPTTSESSTPDISNVPTEYIPGTSKYLHYSFYVIHGDDVAIYNAECKGTLLTTLISNQNLSDYGVIRLSSINSLSDVDITTTTDEDPLQTGWIFMFPAAWVQRDTIGYVAVCDEDDWDYLQTTDDYRGIVYKACMSCVIDLRTATVTLYYDNDFKKSIGVYNLDEMFMAYSYDSQPGVEPSEEFRLGDTMNITAEIFPPSEYMDIRYGVSMED